MKPQSIPKPDKRSRWMLRAALLLLAIGALFGLSSCYCYPGGYGYGYGGHGYGYGGYGYGGGGGYCPSW